ncbi:type III-B CRISPR-associated protein Cas10/Cmr2 [Sorangium sp. So ce1153]|uniref:type III-B CRISPR-associated protein Cas10/Cmr2 n=1 Tax=Sorangium sp. So ce1153 TaxID=3133333 RepID=UPI003F5E0D0A
MPEHLLVVSLAPAHESLQEFISRARRCHDLWFGSWLVAALSKAVARGVAEAIGPAGHEALLFPAPASAEELAPASSLTVANKVLALVPADLDPAEVARSGVRAFEQERDRWTADIFGRVGRDDRRRTENFHEHVARAQVAELFEASWVVVPLGGGFPAARAEADRLLAARKRTRAFRQPAWTREGVPKSSLDGLRDAVLDERIYDRPVTGRARPAALGSAERRRFYDVHGSERLCGVGLLKRFGRRVTDEAERIPSTNHLSTLPFLRGLDRDQARQEAVRRAWRDYRAALEDAGVLGEFQDAPPPLRSSLLGRIDGGVLYPGRVREALEDAGASEATRQIVEERRRALLRSAGRDEPSAYYAILVADGDSMGDLLSTLGTPGELRRLSATLARFARERVPAIVQEGEGALLYAGGDDVLALLPLHRALTTAMRVAQAFREELAPWATSGRVPSMSAGLAVVHSWSPLEEGLGAARDAEMRAKARYSDATDKKNALAIAVHKRSGEPLTVCGRWDALVPRLQRIADLQVEDELPGTMIEELAALERLVAGLHGETQDKARAIQRVEARRILGRKDIRSAVLEELGCWIDKGEIDGPALGREVAVARVFARAAKEAQG